MPLTRRTIRSILSLATAVLAAALVPGAEASPTLTYTVKDLGSAFAPPPEPWITTRKPVYGSDAGGGLVFGADGSAYRFNPSSYSKIPSDGLPLVLPTPPSDFSNSPYSYKYSYNNISGAYQNANGKAVYFETTGVEGHTRGSETALLVDQKGADGKWEYPRTIGDTAVTNVEGDALLLAGFNGMSQVLVRQSARGDLFDRTSYLYDAVSGTKVDLGKIVGPAYLPFETTPLALDSDGRILLAATINSDYGVVPTTDLLLLTPTNLDDSAVSVPEPSLVAFVACIVAGVAIRMGRRTRTA